MASLEWHLGFVFGLGNVTEWEEMGIVGWGSVHAINGLLSASEAIRAVRKASSRATCKRGALWLGLLQTPLVCVCVCVPDTEPHSKELHSSGTWRWTALRAGQLGSRLDVVTCEHVSCSKGGELDPTPSGLA